MKKLLAALALSCLIFAQSVDQSTNARIRKEEAEHSQVMHTLHMLTDRYGPRLTGSPNFENAARWAVAELTRWGFQNAHLEAWDFGHPGWLNESAYGFMVAPVRENLKFEVLGWTPSTKGAVAGSAIELAPPQGPLPPAATDAAAGRGGAGRGAAQRLPPTKEELTQWLEANRDKIRGKMVLLGKAAVIPVNFNPPAKRRPDDQVKAQFDPNNPNAGRGAFGGRGTPPAPDPSRLTAAQVTEMVDAWLLANGALVRINDAAMEHGLVRAFQNRTYDPAKVVPTVVMRNEDYGRIERLLADGEDVKLEFNIVNRDYPEGKTSYNVVAEIPGTDKAGEIVMLGGHLDSWHAATGATDNAIGSSMMMEAARIIQALGLKPRRTIRVGLWSGEEEGLLGSLAYVKQHFGSFENPKPEFATLDCYFNIDSGTGRVRGASVFGPPEAAAMLRNALEPFADLGVAGAMPSNSRNVGGTDSTSFSNAGLAGIGLQQDPIEYQSTTWHTNLDTYERIVPEDVMNASTVIAAAVWHVANRDQMVPRFVKETMPAPPATR
ncbi:Peptidase M28 [Candidatus Sulfopaludibacter sp. SbA4]|nr:Peptidase M28 [Candidatus Sulfopaludibacter sp. SbA4]